MEPSSMILGPAVKEIYALARERLSKRLDKSAPVWEPLFNRLDDYVGEVLRWSSRIQFFGMPVAKDTDEATIDLKLSGQPRRFRSSVSPGQTISETDLLADPYNYVILGDPGSGKTTTLKRLARAVMLNEPSSSSDIYRYPVVIRLRDHISATDPDLVVAKTLGLPGTLHNEGREDQFSTTGFERLETIVPQFLDSVNAVLLLDGLDELPSETKRLFEEWIVKLAYRLSASKIVVTSRSGDYYRHLDGFNILELCPLGPEQAEAIAQRWLPNAGEFLRMLRALPYHDLADRPLLLSQLIVLFHRQGTLPEQPAHVYRRLLRLLLEDWDKERGISRSSRYAGFDPDRKLDFLAALSYRLTYRLRASSFTLRDLAEVYGRIHRLFGLPQTEGQEVAEEIASHSGLIAASSTGFEFSHLSFQEYLCAAHLVREPFPEYLHEYVTTRPGPLAIAVAISGNPAEWFAGLILKEANLHAFNDESLQSFLARVRIERPLFDTNAALGTAVMQLFYESLTKPEIRDEMQFLFEDQAVLDSINAALSHYVVPKDKQSRAGEFVLHKGSQLEGSFKDHTPEVVSLPQHVLTLALQLRWIPVSVTGAGGWSTLRMDSDGTIRL